MQWLAVFSLFAQSTYYGPTSQPSPLSPHLVKVQIQAYDDPDLGGAKIASLSFNQTAIPLKPSDIYGFRGSAGFQLKAGSYSLNWETSNGTNNWPRTIKHQQQIQVQDKDVWVQISIQGEKVVIL